MASPRPFARVWLLSLFVLSALSCWAGLTAQPVKKLNTPPAPTPATKLDASRYPFRVPEWLWTDQRRTSAISESLRKELESDIAVLAALNARGAEEADKKSDAIAKRLGEALCLRDLTADATVHTSAAQKAKLGVQIDPTFDEPLRKMLVEAVRLFVEYGLDDDVIETAWKSSIDDPSPAPEKYQTKDGKPVLDAFGNKVYTDDYKYFLTSRSRPANVASFKAHLRSVLCRADGDPALLIISRYSGNPWWGRAYIDFYTYPAAQLSRTAPAQGFLYIALNSDRMARTEPNWDSAAFWAGKVAHECLHNLGYDHPAYTSPAQRDENNRGDKKAFIVAYELAVTEKAKKATK